MTRADDGATSAHNWLMQHLDARRAHVLRTVHGLSEDDLDRVVARSGWTPRSMLNHLLYDAEIFWIQAVLGGRADAIRRVRDGWTAPSVPGPELRGAYQNETERGNETLRTVNLDEPPAWWPPSEVFGGGQLGTGWEIVLRVLDETSIHAGHLDMAREAIDGHQNLVVG